MGARIGGGFGYPAEKEKVIPDAVAVIMRCRHGHTPDQGQACQVPALLADTVGPAVAG